MNSVEFKSVSGHFCGSRITAQYKSQAQAQAQAQAQKLSACCLGVGRALCPLS
jgi:hypothetical protein